MKVFMITWGGFCFLVIVGLLVAYVTDQLPGVPTPQSRAGSGIVELETEEDCSPCEENLKRLRKVIEQAGRERKAAAVAVSNTHDSP